MAAVVPLRGQGSGAEHALFLQSGDDNHLSRQQLLDELARLVPVESGTARFHGIDLLELAGAPLHAMRRHLQLFFQNPLGSLDPRMNIGDIIGEPLRVRRGSRRVNSSGGAAQAPIRRPNSIDWIFAIHSVIAVTLWRRIPRTETAITAATPLSSQ